MPDRAAVNAHTHLYSGLALLGMPAPAVAPQNFLQILERIWWRLDRALDAESLRASARYYVADALLAGTPVLIDHHESPSLIDGSLDILADACAELGARALLGYGATERNGGRDEARRGLAECRRFITSNRRPGIAGAFALHASFTVSDETIADAMAMARELGAIVHVHVAEDRADVTDAKKRGYDGPLERLLAFGIPFGSILAHGVHLDERQMQLANDAGLWIVQNPRSNAGNRVGYPAAMDSAANVALGTDGYPARMRDEVALLEESEPENEILRRVNGSARLARQLFGEFEDLAVRRDDRVESLVVDGREVVRDGRLVSGDIEEIRAYANEQATRLWKRM